MAVEINVVWRFYSSSKEPYNQLTEVSYLLSEKRGWFGPWTASPKQFETIFDPVPNTFPDFVTLPRGVDIMPFVIDWATWALRMRVQPSKYLVTNVELVQEKEKEHFFKVSVNQFINPWAVCQGVKNLTDLQNVHSKPKPPALPLDNVLLNVAKKSALLHAQVPLYESYVSHRLYADMYAQVTRRNASLFKATQVEYQKHFESTTVQDIFHGIGTLFAQAKTPTAHISFKDVQFRYRSGFQNDNRFITSVKDVVIKLERFPVFIVENVALANYFNAFFLAAKAAGHALFVSAIHTSASMITVTLGLQPTPGTWTEGMGVQYPAAYTAWFKKSIQLSLYFYVFQTLLAWHNQIPLFTTDTHLSEDARRAYTAFVESTQPNLAAALFSDGNASTMQRSARHTPVSSQAYTLVPFLDYDRNDDFLY